MLRWLALLAFSWTSVLGWAQYATAPLNRDHARLLESWQRRQDSRPASACKPSLVSIELLDSLREGNTATWTRRHYEGWVMRKLKNEHLLEVREDDFYLNGDFVFDLTTGRDRNDPARGMLYTNTRGFRFEGAVGERVFFNTSFYENQSIFPAYLEAVVSERQSVPGMGRYKTFENFAGDTAYDYAFATGAAGVALNDYTFLQFGYDHQFVGEGFRSILLSDASFPYPFLRGNLGLWKGRVQYSITWAMLQGLERIPLGANSNKEFPFERKLGKFSYLSFIPWRWMELGVFTSSIQPYWTVSGDVDPAWDYYVPSGVLSYARRQGKTYRLVGLNTSVSVWRKFRLYAQAGQSSSGKAPAYQLGVHLLDPFRWNHLSLRVEYNRLPLHFQGDTSRFASGFGLPLPDAYQYQHNNQFLAHPLGENLDEWLVNANVRFRDVMLSATLMSYGYGSSPRRAYVNAEAGYILNPMSMAQVAVGATYRTDGVTPGTRWIYFSFRTRLINRYSEF